MSKAISGHDYNEAISACKELTHDCEKYFEIDKKRGSEYEFEHEAIGEIFTFFKIFIDAHFEKMEKPELEDRFNQLHDRYEALKEKYPLYADRIKFYMNLNGIGENASQHI
jgi:hypothetical protein